MEVVAGSLYVIIGLTPLLQLPLFFELLHVFSVFMQLPLFVDLLQLSYEVFVQLLLFVVAIGELGVCPVPPTMSAPDSIFESK